MNDRKPAHEAYSAGYSPLVVEALSERDLQVEAAFFLPYLEPGMSLLDCGCGPGAMTVDLAKIVAPGQVVGIDRHEPQLELGRQKATAAGVDNVRFEQGDIYSLPFEDGALDAVFAHAVIYHLARPEAALAEIRRVLKRGGLVGIRDADFDRDIKTPLNPALESGFSLMDRVLAHSGAQLAFGRTQREVLRRAGFVDIVASASFDHFGTPDRAKAFSEYWAYYVGELHRDLILENGWADQTQIDEVLAAFRAWGEHPDAFYARCRCEAVALSPS
jgi:ubiquinone/menaquinone biosynthesis C-methylase UbiE